MVTESVNIAFRATGIPIIKRQIDELGNAANRASHGFFLLQRALYTLGGFGLARILTSSLDALTNMENRLRLTTNSAWELNKVQNELFEIAKRSRSSWEGVSEIYNRAALSAKALGIAQQDVLIFTEGVAKAAAISGAGTQEARAALIQLGQAVASNRLGGDELRSVLEQLPFAADVIADYMTKTGEYGEVTRGNIRALGAEGKITAKVIVEAFKSAEGELADLFENMPLTIGQALEIARTSFVQFLDEFDDSTGFSDKLANSILVVADNLDLIAKAAAGLAIVFGVGLFGRAARSLGEFTNGIKANIVQQKSLRERLVSIRTASVANAAQDVAMNAQRQKELSQNIALIAQKKILLQQEVLEAQYSVRNGAARNLQTGRYISLAAAKANLAKLTQNLAILEGVEAAQAARLGQARALQGMYTAALAGTTARLQAAQAGATLGARAMAAGNAALTASMTFLKGAATSLFMFIGGWPGILLAAGAAIIGLVSTSESAAQKFERLSQSTAGSNTAITELTDVQERLNEAILAAGPASDLSHNTIIANTHEELRAKLALLELERDSLVRLQQERQSALDQAAQGLVVLKEQLANAQQAIQALQNLPMSGAIAANIADLEKVIADMSSRIKIAEDGAKRLGAEFALTNGQIDRMTDAISSGYNDILIKAGGVVDKTTSFAARLLDAVRNGTAFSNLNMGAAVDPAISAADKLIQRLINGINLIRRAIGLANSGSVAAESTDPFEKVKGVIDSKDPFDSLTETFKGYEPASAGGGGGGGGGEPKATFSSELADLQKKIDLERQYGIQKEANNTILAIEDTLKRSLSASEKEQISNTTRLLEIAKIQGQILEEINAPQERLILGQQALNELFAQGAISLEVYNTKLREMQIAADQASQTMAGGFRSAIAGAIMSAQQLGQALGDWVVGAAGSAADAIVEFAKTGEFNVKQFFGQLFAQLLKLAAQQILLRLLGGIIGVPIGGMSGGGSILPGFAGGGSILPVGPGSTDSQIVAFKKRPDERVDVLTPGQQASQRKRMKSDGFGEQKAPVINQKTINVLDPSIVGQYLNTAEGEQAIINVISSSGILDRGQ